VHIFVTFIKNYLNNMADEEKKSPKPVTADKTFGLQILVVVVIIFIIWILMGGNKNQDQDTTNTKVIDTSALVPYTPTQTQSN